MALAEGTISLIGGGGEGGGGTAVATSWADLVAGGGTLGQTAWVPRLLGAGYFLAMHNGTAWTVVNGQTVARLDAPVALTATGTAYVQLASVLAGPLIGNFETWVIRAKSRNAGVYGGLSGNLVFRIGGNATAMGSTAAMTSPNRRCRTIGEFRRSDTTAQRVTANGEAYTNVTIQDLSVADWALFNVECGITPGTIGDTFELEEFYLKREA